MSETITPDAWISVSRSALRHNFAAVQTLLAQGEEKPSQVIAVVKANAYGHGAGETARIFQEAGADFFAVTTPAEAMELRGAGIKGRILVFLPPLPEQNDTLLSADIDLTVCDSDGLNAIAETARVLGKTALVHLKVDSGMGRLGALPGEAVALARKIAETPPLHFAGIYTHFAKALEKDEAATRKQFAVFQKVLADLESADISPGLRHCANSAALVRFPEMRLDAVRPGTVLYGQYPSASVPHVLDLHETWRMQARIIAVREVPAGSAIGYGGEYATRRQSKLAVLPIGYADGFTVAPASVGSGWHGIKNLLRPSPITVTVRGKRAPVLGRVAMQICTVDVTNIPGVTVGDIVTILARRITASARLPRFYEEQFA
ncbi:MAG: alanine racemase [Armatimonadota bacterium]|nr:alanine racemase [Armatimonadota bacterium]